MKPRYNTWLHTAQKAVRFHVLHCGSSSWIGINLQNRICHHLRRQFEIASCWHPLEQTLSNTAPNTRSDTHTPPCLALCHRCAWLTPLSPLQTVQCNHHAVKIGKLPFRIAKQQINKLFKHPSNKTGIQIAACFLTPLIAERRVMKSKPKKPHPRQALNHRAFCFCWLSP